MMIHFKFEIVLKVLNAGDPLNLGALLLITEIIKSSIKIGAWTSNYIHIKQ